MVTVTTKEGLEDALKKKEDKILIEGELAQSVIKKKRLKNTVLIIIIIAAVGAAVLIPFTGGASALPLEGLVAGCVTMSTGELALIAVVALAGMSLAAIALLKEYDIIVEKGRVILTRKKASKE